MWLKEGMFMNMDLEKAKQEFLKYTEKYDLTNDKIKLKQVHSLRVMEISEKIAQKLELPPEEIELAKLIGLLHDIARFEQYTKYHTFKDIESVDHGDLGVEILKNDIRKYIKTDQYDNIIFKAIKNHNKYAIEFELSNKEKQFSKIIRDADKIDIFYEAVVKFWKGKEEQVEKSIISEKTVKEFEQNIPIKTRKDETEIDNIIKMIGFIFDINFKASFEILHEEDYINKIFKRYNLKDEYTRKKVEEIREVANEYINQQIRK